MVEEYPVILGSSAVGKARIQREGLYGRIFCRCDLPGETMYRLSAQWGETQIDLGTLVPMGSGFGLETRIPVKRLGEGNPVFRLRAKHDRGTSGKFVPIYPEEPFAYIDRLKDAFLETRDGVRGIVIPENSSE